MQKPMQKTVQKTVQKTADTNYPIHELIAGRWSPLAFGRQPVSRETIGTLLEAARWAASCYNEQPWRYLVAMREDGASFERLAGCLVEGNAWAREAPVLLLAVACTTFERNGKPNAHAWYDVGLSVANLVLQAESLGLRAHQMAGFDGDRARRVLSIPTDHDPIAMIALGAPGDASTLPASLAAREAAPRERRPLDTIAFGAGWGERAPLAGTE